MGAQREQWNDANNFLAVAPGVVMGYERNTGTNAYLADQGIEVIPVVGEELGEHRHGEKRVAPLVRQEREMLFGRILVGVAGVR